MLQNVAGLEFFRTLFPVVLTDNGSEFSDPILLGPKFKQKANRAILRRNEVAL